MIDETFAPDTTNDYTQLTQARIPIDEAADAFSTRDQYGRIPIILVPKRLNRIRNDLVLFALALFGAAVALLYFVGDIALVSLAVVLGIILLILGIYRSFIVRIPEGSNALLIRGGRYIRTISSGTQIVPPWILVSHLITTREIPFDVPVVNVPTNDNVRANVDTLITFRINDPYKFVYNISASDFDQVFQASCQDGLRAMMRNIDSEQVVDLKKEDLKEMLAALSTAVEPYGVTVTNINVTYAQPPVEFMQSLEARQLAILQQEEQKEKQALAIRRLNDEEELARQKVIAHIERERESLQIKYQEAEAKKQIVNLEAEAEALRLQKLEERLKNYPSAAEYDIGTLKLEIARALSGNTRAMLQVGSADDIIKAFVMRDILQDVPSQGGNQDKPAANPASTEE